MTVKKISNSKSDFQGRSISPIIILFGIPMPHTISC